MTDILAVRILLTLLAIIAVLVLFAGIIGVISCVIYSGQLSRQEEKELKVEGKSEE
jgi:uncharacterized SAM-binding protein YcdF (DUF218 family)